MHEIGDMCILFKKFWNETIKSKYNSNEIQIWEDFETDEKLEILFLMFLKIQLELTINFLVLM